MPKKRRKKKAVRKKPKKIIKKPCVKPVFKSGFQATPLKSSFMVVSIIGFFVSILWVGKYSQSLAFAFAVVFFAMFIASMVSMARAQPGVQLPRPKRPIK